MRAWWQDGQNFRVDQLSDDGEVDSIRQGSLLTRWDSTRDEEILTVGAPNLRLPESADLLPPSLAQRLIPRDLVARATRLGAQRIAGRTALALRLTPSDSATTVGHIDVEVDQDTGLPLAISVTAKGAQSPAVTSRFLEMAIGVPADRDIAFVSPAHIVTRAENAPDLVAEANEFAPFRLPDTLAGLPRTQRISGLARTGGVGTYGRGDSLLALIPLRPDLTRQVIKALAAPVGRPILLSSQRVQAQLEQLPLFNVVVFPNPAGRNGFLLGGTVTPDVLERAGSQIVDSPPPLDPIRLSRLGRG